MALRGARLGCHGYCWVFAAWTTASKTSINTWSAPVETSSANIETCRPDRMIWKLMLPIATIAAAHRGPARAPPAPARSPPVDRPYRQRRGAVVLLGPKGKPVPDPPVRFAVPAQCRFCATLGSVGMETTIQGRAVRLTWCCRNCGRDWPVQPDEQLTTDRRAGPADRRRATRAQRRAS